MGFILRNTCIHDVGKGTRKVLPGFIDSKKSHIIISALFSKIIRIRGSGGNERREDVSEDDDIVFQRVVRLRVR